jgi:hypothetical protein
MQFTPCRLGREITETNSQNNTSEARYKIAKSRVSPGHPHLQQFDGCREERQSNELDQITPWITKHECQARQKKYRQMLERSRDIRDHPRIGRNYRKDQDTNNQNPGKNLGQRLHN